MTILPRGRALGYTMVMPDSDKYSKTRGELLDQLAYMLGGRAAEELVFHDPTTGAANDIEKATNVARAMVTKYGMTERLGAVKLGSDSDEPFLGMQAGMGGGHRDYSDAIAAAIDEEVAALINTAHQEAFDCLVANREVLDELVRQLFEKETLDKDQVAQIFEALQRWPKRPAWTGSDTRVPSELPPVDPPPPAPKPEQTYGPPLQGPNGTGPIPVPAGPQPPAGPGYPGQPPQWQPPYGQPPQQQQPPAGWGGPPPER